MRDYLNQLPVSARDVKLNLIKQLELDDEAWSPRPGDRRDESLNPLIRHPLGASACSPLWAQF